MINENSMSPSNPFTARSVADSRGPSQSQLAAGGTLLALFVLRGHFHDIGERATCDPSSAIHAINEHVRPLKAGAVAGRSAVRAECRPQRASVDPGRFTTRIDE
jgi:hypothetical protein